MKRLLIANRGEIALRIARTACDMGIETVAVYSDADADSPHVRAMDFAVRIGAAPLAQSYLSIDAALDAARTSAADAVHPGYGFLAESPEFAGACAAAGLIFVGPSAGAMRDLGNKAAAKRLLAPRGIPFLPGYHGDDQSDDVLSAAARELGTPLMIKAAAGGGGRGMRLVEREEHFLAALHAARSEALAAFGNDDVLLERALLAPRHIEVQVFADAFGSVVHLGERDCSVQRRNQKLIEEAPSPAVNAALRERLGAVAIDVVRATNYTGAATVEFLLAADGAFYFIEVNARLQVEHAVTERIAGIDLVEWQLRVARGEPLPLTQEKIRLHGHAIEVRLCAEDPARDFLPQTGTLLAWKPPWGLSVEAALEPGITITPYYDSMIAKFIAFAPTRDEARLKLVRGLDDCVALGVPTNASALRAYLCDATFIAGAATTRFVAMHRSAASIAAESIPKAAALAAATLFWIAAEAGDFGPWTAWSSSHVPSTWLRLSLDDGAVHEVVIAPRGAHDVRATIGDATFAIALAHTPSRWRARVRFDDEPWRQLTFAHAENRLYFTFEGRTFACVDRSAEPAVAPATATNGDGFVRAPMSGRVVHVGGSAGDARAAGTPLVVIEAMKMEHILTLPVDVVLREVTAVAGGQVHANDILLAYEPATR